MCTSPFTELIKCADPLISAEQQVDHHPEGSGGGFCDTSPNSFFSRKEPVSRPSESLFEFQSRQGFSEAALCILNYVAVLT